MIQERQPSTYSAQRGSGFTFGMAFTLVVGVFAIAIPIFAYLCRGFTNALDAPISGTFQAFVVSRFPWLPVLIGLVGATVLLIKEQRFKPALAAKANIAAIITTIVVGGFTLFAIFVPMMRLIQALSG